MINLVRMLTVDEGLKNKVYKDPAGNKTVGIGFNMDDPHARGVWIMADVPESFLSVYNGYSQISTESAWKLLNVQTNNAIKDLKTVFDDFDTYPDGAKYALINIVFNIGLPKFSKFNTFIGLIKSNDFDAASDDLAQTALAHQLPNRYKRVCALLKGDDSLYGANS